MKPILITFIILFAHISNSQNPCHDIAGNWHLEMGNTYLPISYTVQTDSSTTMNNLFIMANSLTGSTNVKIFNNMVFFEVKNLPVDMSKFGLPRMKTPIYALQPMNFKVVIEYIKSGYKVKVSSITTLMPSMSRYDSETIYDWNYTSYNKEGCIKKLSYNAVINMFSYLELFLIDYFKIKG